MRGCAAVHRRAYGTLLFFFFFCAFSLRARSLFIRKTRKPPKHYKNTKHTKTFFFPLKTQTQTFIVGRYRYSTEYRYKYKIQKNTTVSWW